MARLDEKYIIGLTPFGMDFVFTIYYLAAPLVLIELKASPVELGLVGTITSFLHMGMANFMGPLSDRLGRRKLIIAAPLLFTVSCLLMTRVNQIPVILALSAVNGLCLSLFWPSFQAWIADLLTGVELARQIGTFNMSWTAAYFSGPVLSGFLYGLRPRLPFYVAAAISLVVFFFVYATVKVTKTGTAGKEDTSGKEKSTRFRPYLYAAWVGNFVSFFFLGNLRYQFPKLARELNISPQMIGVLLGCIGFSQFFGFLILRRSEGWHFKRFHLLGAQLLAWAGMAVIFLSSHPLPFALAFMMIGLTSCVTYYSSLFYAVHLGERKGRMTGLHESILGSGAVLGPILGGVAAQFTGLRAPYVLCIIVLSIAWVVEFLLMKRCEACVLGKGGNV